MCFYYSQVHQDVEVGKNKEDEKDSRRDTAECKWERAIQTSGQLQRLYNIPMSTISTLTKVILGKGSNPYDLDHDSERTIVVYNSKKAGVSEEAFKSWHSNMYHQHCVNVH